MKIESTNGNFWQGENIRLRSLQIEDAEKKLAEYNDTQARSWLEAGMELPQISLEAYREGLKDMCDFKDTSRMTAFTIETLEGEAAGWINMFGPNMRNGTFSIGISVYREYRQNGYAAEAMRVLMRYGFYQLRSQKCDSVCLDGNEGSIRLHEKLGFIREGRKRRAVYLNGEFVDEILWGVLKEEFDANEEAYQKMKNG